jgi:hypothetical protein
MARSLLVLMVMLTIGGGLPVRAQEATPEPTLGPAALQMLPEATVFGEGWQRSQLVNPEALSRSGFSLEPETFREGAAGIYVGPAGSRILVVSLLINASGAAVRQSWDEAGELLDSVRSEFSSGYHSDEALEVRAAPSGCVAAKHLEGVDNHALLPVGATMCAIEPDGILITVVYGTLNGEDGVAASDAAIARVLQP